MSDKLLDDPGRKNGAMPIKPGQDRVVKDGPVADAPVHALLETGRKDSDIKTLVWKEFFERDDDFNGCW